MKTNRANSITGIFKKDEITGSKVIAYGTVKHYKIFVFVPESYLEKVFIAMSKSGAGVIGNYRNCSFRTIGTGTFLPLENSEPYSGKAGELSIEREYKLEMECGYELLQTVIENMINAHPYEEVAYEIYEFFKLSKNPDTIFIKLKRVLPVKAIIQKLNQKITDEDLKMNQKVKTVVLTTDEHFLSFNNADILIQLIKGKYKIKILNNVNRRKQRRS
ncbi:hypothetical protein FBQ84_07010 [Ignavibacteria bacterium CHB1]|nr:MAG: hypothetical protein EDM69_07055 [Chlorobiota bacterium]MBV6399264.1 hypothetical protein [Ignavibacteria bacterium]MCC6884937.1 hypothetical protein [Ignavibacteriales bacterium]MCE7953532.1 hypothetical protein [Chlorobi bacterium CHB7]MDL1887578.1 hypothetical protein [Ignavibacteria bacterium CHB1]RIK49279.1 MAG: hypothetical protein DCC60_04840 [Ignavibacteriota bacterium]